VWLLEETGFRVTSSSCFDDDLPFLDGKLSARLPRIYVPVHCDADGADMLALFHDYKHASIKFLAGEHFVID